VLGFSAWLCRIGRRVGTFRDGVLYPVIGMGMTAALIMGEPDYGTTFLIGCVAVVLLFTAGVKIRYLAGLVTLGVGGFAAMVAQDEVRRGRVLAFLMPDKYPTVAYHLDQSKIAFIKGGAFGVGLGDSIQKHLYLPEAHTDFILAIIGEELGLIATGMVVLLFAAILFCGVTISLRARDAFGRLMAMGLTTSIVLQAAINVGVVTGCFPTKGLPLPFISYGGSSLVASVAMVAVLLNIAKHADEQGEDEHTRSIKNRRHDF